MPGVASSRPLTAVLCAAFLPADDAAIATVRDAAGAAGAHVPLAPAHRPHLTLAAARVAPGAELDAFVAVAAALADDQAPIPLLLDTLGCFDRGGVLWLGPAASAELMALQRAATGAVRQQGWADAFAPHTDPGQWVPHCTLARVRGRAVRRVRDRLMADFVAMPVVVSALAVIEVGGRGDLALAALSGP